MMTQASPDIAARAERRAELKLRIAHSPATVLRTDMWELIEGYEFELASLRAERDRLREAFLRDSGLLLEGVAQQVAEGERRGFEAARDAAAKEMDVLKANASNERQVAQQSASFHAATKAKYQMQAFEVAGNHIRALVPGDTHGR